MRGTFGKVAIGMIALILVVAWRVGEYRTREEHQTQVIAGSDIRGDPAPSDQRPQTMGLQLESPQAQAEAEHPVDDKAPKPDFTLKMFLNGFRGEDGTKNPVIKVVLEQTITIKLVNGDSFAHEYLQTEHDFHIDELEVHSEPTFRIGESTTVTFTASKDGRFNYYCAIPNHRGVGMEGTIAVIR